MRAAHATASSREGSLSTVKPPLSGGAHEYPPAENVPSADTTTGGSASSIPPPKTYTPAAFASSITACASRPTASHSPSGTSMAALGKEIRYLAMVLLLGTDGSRGASVRPDSGELSATSKPRLPVYDQRCQAGQPASAALVCYASSYALWSA